MASAGHQRSLAYRPALDGVRAVAVLVVMAYHLGWLRGGFLGVDVFFVLSGYLITTLLLMEIRRENRIHLGNFWVRRARRLFPALVLVLFAAVLATMSTGAFITYAARRADIIATLFYYANWHFIASDQSYFSSYAGVSPLRHMWSLAIEEQFYLVWPLVVAIVSVAARRRRLVVLLVFAVAASLISAVLMALRFSAADPSRSYFGTDTRANVLLVGCALALAVNLKPSLLRVGGGLVARGSLALAGAAALAIAFVGDQDRAYYTGGALAFAVLVGLCIWTAELETRTLLSRALAAGPLPWIGRISYGLYLWHWPLICWIGWKEVGPANLRKPLEVCATFAIAVVSFYVVERPIRTGNFPILRRSHLRFVLAAGLAAVAVTGAAVAGTRSPNLDMANSPCPPGSPHVGIQRWCVRVNPTIASPRVVVTAGDSTSLSLSPGMDAAAFRYRWRFIQAGYGGCSITPLPVVRPDGGNAAVAEAKDCVRHMPRLLSNVRSVEHPDLWIVSDRVLLRPLRLRSGAVLGPLNRQRAPVIAAHLSATLRSLTSDGAHVIFVATPPMGAPAECGTNTRGSRCGGTQYSVRDPSTVFLNRIYRRVTARIRGVSFVSVTDILCPLHGQCPAKVEGVLARYDGVHYTAAFSRRIVPIILRRALGSSIYVDPRHGQA